MTDTPDNDRLDTPVAPDATPPGAATATIAPDAPTEEIADHPAPPPPVPPPAPTPAAGAPDRPRRTGVVVPVWLLLALAGLVLFGLGMLVGSAVSGDDHGAVRSSRGPANGFTTPGGSRDGRSGTFGGRGRQPGPGTVPNQPGQGGNAVPPGGTTQSGVFLGVGIADSSDPAGASITRVVASSPAAAAGLQVDDVITAVDGTAVKNANALSPRDTGTLGRRHRRDHLLACRDGEDGDGDPRRRVDRHPAVGRSRTDPGPACRARTGSGRIGASESSRPRTSRSRTPAPSRRTRSITSVT